MGACRGEKRRVVDRMAQVLGMREGLFLNAENPNSEGEKNGQQHTHMHTRTHIHTHTHTVEYIVGDLPSKLLIVWGQGRSCTLKSSSCVKGMRTCLQNILHAWQFTVHNGNRCTKLYNFKGRCQNIQTIWERPDKQTEIHGPVTLESNDNRPVCCSYYGN